MMRRMEKLWFEITEAAAISNVHSVADFHERTERDRLPFLPG